MNPLDLQGPEFLALYLLYAAAVVALLHALRHFGERAELVRTRVSDPDLIAYLRGGPNEALRVATVSLVDRHLLRVEDELLTARSEGSGTIRDPLERALFDAFESRAPASSVFADSTCQAAAERLGISLERQKLIAGNDERAGRRLRLALAIFALGAVAVMKVDVALARDRPFGFLLVLAALAIWAAWSVHDPRRTRSGELVLEDLRTLFARLKGRARQLHPARDAPEAALLAAVFGVGMLPEAGWLHVRSMYAKSITDRGSGSRSSCGSACGSVSGGDGGGGSGCGGGGCGGGCGGCGS